MDWQQQVLDELESAQAQVTALMVNADTGEAMINLDMEKPVVSASTIKVAIMLHALERVEQGTLTLEQQLFIPEKEILPDTTVFEYGAQSMSVGELIQWMIIESDNTATNALIRLLGMDRINEYCQWLGLTATRIERLMLDFDAVERGLNNYTSAKDQCNMFLALYHHSILTPELCAWAMDVLFGQRHKADFLRYIPDNIQVAHKTGSLDNLDHDSGIFLLNGVHFYLGVFVSDAPSNAYAQQLLGRVGKMIYDEFK